MKIPKNKFIINHKYNSSSSSNNSIKPKIFHMTITTTTKRKVTVTAAIMIFMQAIVSVNTTQNILHIQPETDITTVVTRTWTKTQFDLNKNPVIVQKQQQQRLQPYQSTKTKSQQTLLKSPMPLPKSLSLNVFQLSDTWTGTIAKPSPATPPPPVTEIHRMTRAINGRTGGNGECKSLSEAWGDVDPNIFYICDIQIKKPLQLRCPEGRGFFLGFGFSGCIPYEQWPACLSTGHHEQMAVCDSEHMQQPWETVNPNKFYVCLKESIEPAILSCETGKGFVHAIVTTSSGSGGSGSGSSSAATREGSYGEIVGCANWEKWRNYMQCNDYY